MWYRTFQPESKWIFNDKSYESDIRLVKKDGMRATCFSVVNFVLVGVLRGILTSPYASIRVSILPASTILLLVARAFY